ncbi:MAG TPA: hypothetical protein PLW44_12260 [Chitinophagales bacterium]|nr:hypothetical protein [Chitinophagales bacterium]
MKKVLKAISCVMMLTLFVTVASAQNEVAVNVPKATAIVENPTAPAANTASKEITIVLRNGAEKSVAVFAGPKDQLKEPKITVVGGLSKNNLYLKENDAVCLMTVDKRPVACTIIKPGITTVEVNASANGITSK